MSLWKKYLSERQLWETLDGGGRSPADNFRFNSGDSDFGEDYEKIQQELFKVVLSKYPNETMDFLNTLANRGDEEVAALLRKLRKDGGGPRLPKEPQHPTDGDEVVPSSADTGHNPEYGNDGG